MKKRAAEINRKTKEVDIKGKFNIDGQGKSKINTGFKSLDHMLELFSFHGLFDLELKAKGDLEHHIVEDIGIALGDALKSALGSVKGIRRYATTTVPMDEILAKVDVDISGRPFLSSFLNQGKFTTFSENLDLKSEDFKTFLESFVSHSKITLHITWTSEETKNFYERRDKAAKRGFESFVKKPQYDTHHIFEAIFKALGIALDQATQIDPRRKGIPSTKGVID